VNYVGGARGEAVVATAQCVRRAKEINFATVEAVCETSGNTIATAMMTYRIVP
jgi:acyl-coenzyme A thioesterase PaaI-like protein